MQPEIRIYQDGKLDRKATYTPVIRKKLYELAENFNQFFATQAGTKQ